MIGVHDPFRVRVYTYRTRRQSIFSVGVSPTRTRLILEGGPQRSRPRCSIVGSPRYKSTTDPPFMKRDSAGYPM